MNFADKELCEKLQKIGCVSENKFFAYHDLNLIDSPCDECIPAFTPCDFIGPTEMARENCRKVFETKEPKTWIRDKFFFRDFCECHRHKLIDLPDIEAFWAYIGEGL